MRYLIFLFTVYFFPIIISSCGEQGSIEQETTNSIKQEVEKKIDGGLNILDESVKAVEQEFDNALKDSSSLLNKAIDTINAGLDQTEEVIEEGVEMIQKQMK